MNEDFNIIPFIKNTKRPSNNWEQYKTERYPRDSLSKHTGNVGIVCGSISNNLIVIDFDRDPNCDFSIYTEIVRRYPILENTYTILTPNLGYHFYFRVKSMDIYNKLPAKMNIKTDISGVAHIDIQGEGKLVVCPPSKINDNSYMIFTDKPIKEIEDLTIFLGDLELKEEKKIAAKNTKIAAFNFEKMRPPFQDIINGKINIEEYAKKQGKDEFVYWKFLFRELYIYCNIEPQNIYSILEKNQSSFDIKTTEQQLKHHDFKLKPLTTTKLKEYFPGYKIKSKKKAKKLTEEEIEQCNEWWELPDNERLRDIQKIIEFDIVGENERKKALFIFFLKLGDCLSKDLISFVGFKGDPSAGKSYISNHVIKLFPKEFYYVHDSGTAQTLKYDKDIKGKRFIYIKEMKRGLNLIEDLKSIYDGDSTHKVVEKDMEGHFIANAIMRDRMGLLTTYSFEFTQKDLIERSWNLTPDQTKSQTNEIKKFRIEKRATKIERNHEQIPILKKTQFIQKAISILDGNSKIVIWFADKLKPLFVSQNLRIRRDIDKLFDLIEIITLFNQKNREIIVVNKQKYIFSNFHDLQLALDIGKDFFIDITQEIDEIKKLILDYMDIKGFKIYSKGKLDNIEYRNYKLKDISKELYNEIAISDQTIRRKLESLGYDGYIQVIGMEKGKAKGYKKLKHYTDIEINLEQIEQEINNDQEQIYLKYKNKI